MEKSITENGIRVLTASEGFVLTQKEKDENEERIFSSCILLGVNDTEDNWTEWTEEKEMELKNDDRDD